MTRLRQRLDASVPGTTGRAPDTAYPVAYPVALVRRQRLACSLDVPRRLGARTISRTSRSLTARVGGDGRASFPGADRQISGGQRGGWLPVALINLPASFPCTYITTAPTDALEGGES
jgi:hypothetical protein